ncbi:unnamed protein product [Candidula unifasciata]|uniref:Uncharacterized protein n=1 Tax=Candidula unifasciata TaxID=100452 RepID=A0A8S3ZTQ7_9EUPU|nr:unnamed protein product [Candidula unifasciata]
MFVWSAVGNWLARLESMSTNRVRKICFCSGCAVGGVLYFTASFFDVDHKWAAVMVISFGTMLSTIGITTAGLIPLDLAPRYAGFISALISTETSLTSITPPIVVAALTTQGLYEEWRVVWIITALAHVMASVIFLVFGSASIQPWAVASKEKHTSARTMKRLL